MASEVRLKIHELYQHPDPAVKQAADAALQRFQESDAAWTIASELLGDADETVQFFAAQTLYSKVQQVAKGYQKADDAALLQGLVPMLQKHISSQAIAQRGRQRLVLALAAVAVHLCTTTWPNAVHDVLVLAESQPQCGWCALLAMPEQLSSVVHTYVKTNARTQALLAHAPALVAAALRYEPSASGEEASSNLQLKAYASPLQTYRCSHGSRQGS